MKFKLQRYELYEAEFEADTPEEAAILVKYKAYPSSGWMSKGKATYKLINPLDDKVIRIDDINES